MIPVLLGITIIAFLFLKLLPGDPVMIMTAGKATPEQVERLHAEWGLDKPWTVQYGLFLLNALQGDLGTSIVKKAPVLEIILQRIPVSLWLTGYGSLIAILLTVPLAMISAMKSSRPTDHIIRISGMVFMSMPPFWLGLLLLLLFGLQMKLFPIAGWGEGFVGHLQALFLPSFVVGVTMTPMLVQSLRESMLDIMQADYIDVARSKGIDRIRVLFKHVFRNALIPTVTIFAVNLGWLLSGTVVIETVFSIPGMGSLLVQSVLTRDYPAIQGLTLWFGLIVMVINLLADLSYAVIDPRVSYE